MQREAVSVFIFSHSRWHFFRKANYKISFLHSSLFSLLLKIAFGIGNPIAAISKASPGRSDEMRI